MSSEVDLGSSGASGHSIRRGADLDRLAELEDERDHLLRSMRDLEREFAAGDIGADDYATLTDGYTVRAAAVLNDIDACRRRLGLAPLVADTAGATDVTDVTDEGSSTRSPTTVEDRTADAPDRRAHGVRRRARLLAIWVVVALVGGGIGLALASAWGERGAGQEITGFSPADDARTILANARAAMGRGDFALANELFFSADQRETERGVENAEARAYFGWTLALLSRSEPDELRRERILDAARLALGQAIEIEPTYPDPQCFLAIVEYQFRDDADAALPYVERCEASNPPADIAGTIEAFAAEIRAAAGG